MTAPDKPARRRCVAGRRAGRAWEMKERRFLTRAELAALLDEAPAKWLPLFELLAVTGLDLRGDRAALERPSLRRPGATAAGQPRDRQGRRRSAEVAARQAPRGTPHRARCDATGAAPARRARRGVRLPGREGGPSDPGALPRRVLVAAAQRAGLTGVGFHTLRHTCASLLIESGMNVLRLQRWMGHHSPAFTLEVYGHLLDGDLGPPLDLRAEVRASTGSRGVASAPGQKGASHLTQCVPRTQPGSHRGRSPRRNSQDLWIGVSRDLLITTL